MGNWTSRPLTAGERELVRWVFGEGIDAARVRVMREKFAFFQPREVTMAPDGNIWFHPRGGIATSKDVEDFSLAGLAMRKHFVHELTHVWQHQRGVDLVWEKLLMCCRYGALGGYEYEEGEDFLSYNIEQQACVVADWYEKGILGRGDDMELERGLGSTWLQI